MPGEATRRDGASNPWHEERSAAWSVASAWRCAVYARQHKSDHSGNASERCTRKASAAWLPSAATVVSTAAI